MGRLPPITWVVVVALLAFHVFTGAWALSAGTVDGAWEAWCGVRPNRWRILLGGQYLPLVAEGAWWRLLSSGWVHVDLLHLVFNLIAVAVLGHLLVPLLGSARWLGVMWIGVAAGSLLSHVSGIPQSDGVSSGAFALLGAGMVIGHRWTHLDEELRRLLVRGLGAFAVFNVVLGACVPALDVAGHVGGWVSGMVVALFCQPQTRSWVWGVACAGAQLAVVLGWMGLLAR